MTVTVKYLDYVAIPDDAIRETVPRSSARPRVGKAPSEVIVNREFDDVLFDDAVPFPFFVQFLDEGGSTYIEVGRIITIRESNAAELTSSDDDQAARGGIVPALVSIRNETPQHVRARSVADEIRSEVAEQFDDDQPVGENPCLSDLIDEVGEEAKRIVRSLFRTLGIDDQAAGNE